MSGTDKYHSLATLDMDTPNTSLDLPTQSYPPQHHPTTSSQNPDLANMLPSKPSHLAATGVSTPVFSTQTSARTSSPQLSAFTDSPDPGRADKSFRKVPFVPQTVKLANTTDADLLSYLSARNISPQYLATLDIHIAAEVQSLEPYYNGRPLEVYLRAITTCKLVATYPDSVWSMDGREVQNLSGSADAELLAYMANNNLSPGVLEGADLTIKMNEQNMRMEKNALCRPVLWRRKLALVTRNANPVDLLKFLMYHSYTAIMPSGHSECYLNHPRAMTDLQRDHPHSEPAKMDKAAPKASVAVRRKMRRHLQRQQYLKRQQIQLLRRGYNSQNPAHDLLAQAVKKEADCNLPERRLLDKCYKRTQKAARMTTLGREGKQQKLQLNKQLDFGGGPESALIRGFSQRSIAGDRPVKIEEVSHPKSGNTKKKSEQTMFVKEEKNDVFIKEEGTDDTLLDQLGFGNNIQSDRRMLMQKGPGQAAGRDRFDGQAELRPTNHTSLRRARKTTGIAELSKKLADLNKQILTLQAGNPAKLNKHISALKQQALAAQTGISKVEGTMSEREAQALLQSNGKRTRRKAHRILLCQKKVENKDALRKGIVIMQERKVVDDLTGKLAQLMTQNA